MVIVGGGIMGLALAHNLAKLGCTEVIVLERGYLCAGASGRNGGGVRMQWGTSANIELARRSIDLMKQFAGEMGINVWLRQGGYLFLARSEAIADRLRVNAELHNRLRGEDPAPLPGRGPGRGPRADHEGRGPLRLQPGGRGHLPLAVPLGIRPGGAEARHPGGDLHHA